MAKSALPPLQRFKVLLLHEIKPDLSWKDIARRCQCTVDQALYLVRKGDIVDRCHPGRPSKITEKNRRSVFRRFDIEPTSNLRAIVAEEHISRESIRTTIRSYWFK
jgi:hypothetical protein